MNSEQSKYTAACYCRLSKDDLQDGISVSIETQKKVIEDYCRSNGFSVHDFYCDDGFTGTNFQRPDFQRMMNDVHNGTVNMVVVKDLSRLGRNYIETGRLIEETFPESRVRFIAIGDDVDTDRENLDLDLMLPMKNIFNQYYPADCSRKTRQAFRTKAMRGEFLGTNAPYGYQKSAGDKHVLEIDPVTAPIVVEIFEMVAYKGYGYNKIARELSKRKILTPTAYRCQNEGKSYNKDPYDWNLTSVRRILENTEYLGCVVNGKKKKMSFKSKKVLYTPQEKWIVSENMHIPIISKELWNDAHSHLDSRKRTSKTGEINIFAGLLKCDCCGLLIRLEMLMEPKLNVKRFKSRTPLYIRRRNGVIFLQTQIEVARSDGFRSGIYYEYSKIDSQRSYTDIGDIALSELKKFYKLSDLSESEFSSLTGVNMQTYEETSDELRLKYMGANDFQELTTEYEECSVHYDLTSQKFSFSLSWLWKKGKQHLRDDCLSTGQKGLFEFKDTLEFDLSISSDQLGKMIIEALHRGDLLTNAASGNRQIIKSIMLNNGKLIRVNS